MIGLSVKVLRHDCAELRILRGFRDCVLAGTPEGPGEEAGRPIDNVREENLLVPPEDLAPPELAAPGRGKIG
jgi:hypothetical protein